MRYEQVQYLDVEDVVILHALALEQFGGGEGVLDAEKLDAAVMGPRASFEGMPLLPSLADVAAAYIYYITKLHPFVDANKRTAFLSAEAFLRRHHVDFPLQAQDWLSVGTRLAAGYAVTREDLAVMIAKGIGRWIPIETAEP